MRKQGDHAGATRIRPRLAPEEDGLIVPPADPSALADAILRLVASPATRARMGERGRANVLAQYTTSSIIYAWESLLIEAASCSAT